MLTIELSFPAGRYHATAWGRNVNEGVPEWPPSPYRLARALIDLWRRRRPDWPADRIEAVLGCLAGSPHYDLPATTVGHTRSFMAQKTDQDKKLIFDAFVALDPGARARLSFATTPTEAVAADLQELLAELDYLGRSQSWVDAQLVGTTDEDRQEPPPTGADAVRVACLLPQADYDVLSTVPEVGKGKKKRRASWIDALSLSTNELLGLGWSDPPTLRWTHVGVPSARPPIRRRAAMRRQPRPVEARYRLTGTVLPRVTETVSVAERVRQLLMGIHRRVMGGDEAQVSALLSGKDERGHPARDHEHAYFLPLDEDGDGRIDHLIVRAKGGFSSSEQAALDRFQRFWQGNGRPEVHLALTALLPSIRPEGLAQRFRSATPFVPPRHHRKGRGPFGEWLLDELAREFEHHGLPRPSRVVPIAETLHTPPLRWFEFMRCRKKDRDRPRSGYGFTVELPEAVPAPFAVGYGAHFGLGQFYRDD